MIIEDIKELRDVPIGTEVELKLKIKVVEAKYHESYPCEGCIFSGEECPDCMAHERPDGTEVLFVKI